MRTALSVIAGFVAWSVLWVGGNQLLVVAMPDRFSDDGSTNDIGILIGLLVLSILYSCFSGWLTAKTSKVADNRPATILGVLLLIVGIAVQAGYWNVMPIWYHLAFLAFLFPAAVFGGRKALASTSDGRT